MLGPPKPEDVDTWSLGTASAVPVIEGEPFDADSGGFDDEDDHTSANDISRPSTHNPYTTAADIAKATSWALRKFPLQVRTFPFVVHLGCVCVCVAPYVS